MRSLSPSPLLEGAARALLSGSAAAALVLTASSAFAHIDLLAPVARYVVNRNNGGGGSKSCPCGGPANVIDSNRICDVPAAQSHDTNRSTKVTAFEAGSKITVRMEEYINHSGRFRVAFDPDGADMTDFNSNVLLDVADDKNPQVYEFEVTLPMMTCENCTLQVIQDMNGNTTNKVLDPSPDSTYYTCADIRLVAPSTMGTDPGDDNGTPMDPPPPSNDGNTAGTNGMPMGTSTMGAGNGNTGGSNGNMGTNLGTVPMMGDGTPATTPTMTGSTNTGATTPSTSVGSLMPSMAMSMGTPSTGAPLMTGASESDDSGGCSLTGFGARTPTSPFAALAVAGVFASLAARRRNPRAQ